MLRGLMRAIVFSMFVVGCGSDPGPPLGGSSFDDCELGIASSGGIIEYGQAMDYLVELGRGDTRVHLARRYVDSGVGESKIFANRGMALKHEDLSICVTEPGKLSYENSHHNWLDVAEATEAGTRYRLEMRLDWEGSGGWKYELFGFDAANGAMMFGPVPLDLLSGPRWP